ncbi:MAG: DUF445 family protein [Gemmatimonadaceae bacterium]|nr:DUF445 family protein [Gemmatimonadaceae bacterium]
MTVIAPLPPPDEALRRDRLARMKRLASGLLVLSTLIFLAARALETRYSWLGFVRAAAEAAMIGGLADWLAVTALFRHPMGIPIPHTAIIPEKKDQVGRTLGGFVQKNFLAREVIAARLQKLRIAERLALWLREPENARTIARQVANAIARALPLLEDEDVQQLIDRTVSSRVRNTAVAPVLGKLLSLITAGNRHQELLDQAIRLAARGVAENHDLIRERIAEESPWWVPVAVDEKIHEKIVGSIERTLEDIRDDEEHPLRVRFDEALHQFIDKLQHDPAVIARAEQIKNDTLDADAVRRFSTSLWSDTKEALMRYAERTTAAAAEGAGTQSGALERALAGLGEALLADPHLLARADEAIVNGALAVVERHQDEVGALIASTVKAWDPEVTSQRIELAIGRDLQFIRINGTIVGGLVGLLLYTASRFIG